MARQTLNSSFPSYLNQIHFYLIWGIIILWGAPSLASNPLITSTHLAPASDQSACFEKISAYNDFSSCSELELTGRDTLYLDVVGMETLDTCLSTQGLPGGFANANLLLNPVNNTGTLTVSPSDSCISFFANAGVFGDFIDTMAVVLCDPMMICDTFVIIISISEPPCPVYYFGPDFIFVNDCDTLTQVCLDGGDVSSIGALNISDNGLPYNGLVRGCNIDSSIYYLNLRFDDPGDYLLEKWAVNGDTLRNISFSTLQELVTAMNNFDPNGNWEIDAFILVGGDPDQDYGDLCILANGSPLPPEPARLLTEPNGISLELDTGFHEIVIENSRTTCLDTFSLTLSCQLPFIVDSVIFLYEGTSTLFCLDDSILDTITSIDNLCPDDSNGNVDWSSVLNNTCVELSAEKLGVDTFCLEYCDAVNDTCVSVNLIVHTLPITDTLTFEVGLGFTDTFCVNTNIFLEGADTLFNICPENSGSSISFQIDEDDFCVYYTAQNQGIDSACLVVCDGENHCDTSYLIVRAVSPAIDTAAISIIVGEKGSFCIDTAELAGRIQSFVDICLSGVGNFTDFVIEEDSLCVTYEGIDVGVDTFCLVLCDDSNPIVCDTSIFIISVNPLSLNPPVAIDDFGTIESETSLLLDVLANDTLNGSLINVILSTQPRFGGVTINTDFSISYDPATDICGVTDTFSYVLITSTGQDTASIFIRIRCEELQIFSGFSPNRDGINDTWQILGIEEYPNNEVVLFNRWGNQVYAARGYNNASAWDGTWNGKNLPDGVYFYVIKDGEGNSYNGYVSLQR